MTSFSRELNSLRHRQQFLAILIFSLVAIVLWVSVSLISSQSKTTLSTHLQDLAKPLNPNINTSVLQQIEQKRHLSPDELTGFTIFTVALPEKNRAASPTPAASTNPAGLLLNASQNTSDGSPPATATDSATTESDTSDLTTPPTEIPAEI